MMFAQEQIMIKMLVWMNYSFDYGIVKNTKKRFSVYCLCLNVLAKGTKKVCYFSYLNKIACAVNRKFSTFPIAAIAIYICFYKTFAHRLLHIHRECSLR